MAIDFSNITESAQMVVMWSVVEPELALICANMPLLKTVLSYMMPSFFSSSNRRNNYDKYGSEQQTFSRLQDGQMPSANTGPNTIYPMKRLDLVQNRRESSGKEETDLQVRKALNPTAWAYLLV
ncbi:hypothetical protein N7495_010056 [Penicillium taxi]|uniref:uncharacterized protein n=1 Tax=Penicillium taxi TaxID=168475 RepID=UPI0025459D8D|nr:uncharacterized protein N7495_010056 [Penicillium taxi]KAJ5885546.1 hypothetical protein N7495_010056 [Penicillium taxi]